MFSGTSGSSEDDLVVSSNLPVKRLTSGDPVNSLALALSSMCEFVLRSFELHKWREGLQPSIKQLSNKMHVTVSAAHSDSVNKCQHHTVTVSANVNSTH